MVEAAGIQAGWPEGSIEGKDGVDGEVDEVKKPSTKKGDKVIITKGKRIGVGDPIIS